MRKTVTSVLVLLAILFSVSFVSAQIGVNDPEPTQVSLIEGFHDVLHVGDIIRSRFSTGYDLGFAIERIMLGSDSLYPLIIKSGSRPAIYSNQDLILQYNTAINNPTANVGIGVANPSNKLQVAGGITSQDLNVVNDAVVMGDIDVSGDIALGDSGTINPGRAGILRWDDTTHELQVSKFVVQDVYTFQPVDTTGTSGISGTGTTNKVAKWVSANQVGEGIILDDGSQVFITGGLSVSNDIKTSGALTLSESINPPEEGMIRYKDNKVSVWAFDSASGTNKWIPLLTSETQQDVHWYTCTGGICYDSIAKPSSIETGSISASSIYSSGDISGSDVIVRDSLSAPSANIGRLVVGETETRYRYENANYEVNIGYYDEDQEICSSGECGPTYSFESERLACDINDASADCPEVYSNSVTVGSPFVGYDVYWEPVIGEEQGCDPNIEVCDPVILGYDIIKKRFDRVSYLSSEGGDLTVGGDLIVRNVILTEGSTLTVGDHSARAPATYAGGNDNSDDKFCNTKIYMCPPGFISVGIQNTRDPACGGVTKPICAKN